MNAALHEVVSAPLPYLLRTPGSAGGDGVAARPLLCFLHGFDEGAPMPLRQALTRHGPLHPRASTIAERFIVVAPQLPVRADAWHRHADDVRDIVRQVQALHGGDPARTYLTGFSFGGNGVLDLAPVQRQLWAALWAVDPTRAPATDPGLPLWLSSGALSRRVDDEFRRTLRLAGPGAGSDRIISDAGLDHVGTAAAAYAADTVYHWLLKRGRTD